MKTLTAAVAIALLMATAGHAAEPDAITRQLGLEQLRQHILEINYTPPGYFLVGYTVRVG